MDVSAVLISKLKSLSEGPGRIQVRWLGVDCGTGLPPCRAQGHAGSRWLQVITIGAMSVDLACMIRKNRM